MAANLGNEAYDLSLFEPKKAKVVELKPNKKVQKAKSRKRVIESVLNTTATICISALVVGVLTLVIASRVRISELNRVIEEKQAHLVVLQSEEIRLKDQLARKTSTQSVEEYAENVLGMQKVEANQIVYISEINGDKVVVNSAKDDEPLQDIGSAIANFFKQLAYLFG